MKTQSIHNLAKIETVITKDHRLAKLTLFAGSGDCSILYTDSIEAALMLEIGEMVKVTVSNEVEGEG